MIITVATRKVGSGKSTLASLPCGVLAFARPASELIDADPQRSIVRLAARERALGGVSVVEDASDDASKTARRSKAATGRHHRHAGFRSRTTLDCLSIADFLLIPVKPSPFDVDRMLDTVSILTNRSDGRSRCSAACSPDHARIRHRQAHSRRADQRRTAGAQ